jgi:dCMP deaminase
MPIARAFAAMSKLPGTKVGCLILGEAFQVLSSGWNGAPRGSTADVDKRSVEREERLKWVVHAEMNAIANAARAGTALNGATLLCTLMPCMTCAKSIVQAGIKRVICPAPGADSARWGEEFALATQLFEECDVEVIHSDTIGGQE